jgi:hypothetical protein
MRFQLLTKCSVSGQLITFSSLISDKKFLTLAAYYPFIEPKPQLKAGPNDQVSFRGQSSSANNWQLTADCHLPGSKLRLKQRQFEKVLIAVKHSATALGATLLKSDDTICNCHIPKFVTLTPNELIITESDPLTLRL